MLNVNRDNKGHFYFQSTDFRVRWGLPVTTHTTFKAERLKQIIETVSVLGFPICTYKVIHVNTIILNKSLVLQPLFYTKSKIMEVLMSLKLCEACKETNKKLAGSQVYVPKGSTRVDHAMVIELKAQGKSALQIANTYKCSVNWVYRILKDGK